MLHRTWIIGVSIVALGLLSAACNSPSNGPSDRKVSSSTPRANSTETRPEWANDQPEYMTPVDDLTPEPTARVTDPLHYFTNRQSIMIRQPGNYDTNETPRVSVWVTSDNGYNWKRQGHFGRGQSYFPLQVKGDGDYGVRFVGPGQDPANEVPARPARVYHVDSCPPEVEMWIEPEQTWYNVGDTVTISWRANDPHLIEFPVRIGMMKDFTSDDGRLIEIQGELADEGTLSYVLPPESFDHEVWFRVEAMDRANNMGVAYSFALQVVDTNLAATDELRTEIERVASNDGMTPESARAILDRAAAEYGDLVSSMMTAIREVSERGEEIRRSNAVGDAGPSEYGPTSPVFGREESSNDIAIGDIEPCDENPRNATLVAMNTNDEKEQDGPMSDNQGSLPYATAAAREVADST
ncbi:MAG: hypothetical protein IPK83_15600, partial [Planctomycetes bacterium]|nr:hypothetical protein [Planctomycetota bacterium]